MRLICKLLILSYFALTIVPGMIFGEAHILHDSDMGEKDALRMEHVIVKNLDRLESKYSMIAGHDREVSNLTHDWRGHWHNIITTNVAHADEGEIIDITLNNSAYTLSGDDRIQISPNIAYAAVSREQMEPFENRNDENQEFNDSNAQYKNIRPAFEPGSIAVLGFGIIGLFGIIRWRFRN